MKDNTKQILCYVSEAIEALENYQEYVTENNACAYSDRLIEDAIETIKKIEQLHESQFSDTSVKEDNEKKDDSINRTLDYTISHSNLAGVNHKLESERRLRMKSLPEKFTVKDYCKQINNRVSLIPCNRANDNEVNYWKSFDNLTYAMQNAVVKEVLDFDTLLLESTDEELLKKDLEHLNWSFETHDDYWCLETWSPLGENLVIEANGDIEAFIDEIEAVYDNYDVDEHARYWISNPDGNGVPQSAKDLIEDAEKIEEMYEQLRDVVDAYNFLF